MRKDAKCSRVWPSVPLKDIVRNAQPGFASGRRESTGIIQVRMNNVSTDGNLNLNSFLRVPASEAKPEKYQLIPGDVLFNSTNSPKLVGKSAVFPGHEEPVVFSNHFLRIRVNQSQLDPGYLTRWLTEQWKHRVFEGLCTQWVNQASVRKEDLLSLKIPLPPLPEQRRIAAILDKADAIRRKRQQALRLTEDFLRSAFLDLFGDPVTNPKGWPVITLGKLSSRITKGESPKWQGFSYQDSGVHFVTSENVLWGKLDTSKTKYISYSFHSKLSRSQLHANDVLINLVGASVGRTCIVPSEILPANVNQAVAVVSLDKSKALPEFLLHQLLNPQMQRKLLGNVVEFARANISLSNIAELEVLSPPLEVQKVWGEIVRHMGIMLYRYNSNINLGEDFFNSLIQRAFRSKL